MHLDVLPDAANRPHLVSTTRRVQPRDALELLDEGDGGVRAYWTDGIEQVVALGAAWRIMAQGPTRIASIREETRLLYREATHTSGPDVPSDVGPRWIGGVSFDAAHTAAGRWAAFPSAEFLLPKRQLLWRDGRVYETLTQADAAEQETPSPPEGRPAARPDGAGRAGWDEAVAAAAERIRDGELTKVVLARAERRPTRHHLADVVRRLAKHPDPTFRFLVEPAPGHAFYGSSPELLVRLAGRELATVALAGSIGRGAGAREDAALGRLLLSNPKDSLEHEVVVSWLLEQMANARAENIRHHPRRLLRLTHVQHLQTPIEARAAQGTHVLDLVDRFHPTPAVGGIPRDAALALIRRLEDFSRGWYAGAVGWFDAAGDGAFATAIRSALTTPTATWLFAGAGIVAGSESSNEWDETTVKLKLMEEALAEGEP